VKDDSVNHPTFSYKDRLVRCRSRRPWKLGFDTVSCASTGISRTRSRRTRHAPGSLLRLHPARPPEGKGHRLGDLRASVDRHPREIRLRQSPLQRDRRQIRLGIRQRDIRPYYTEGARHTGSRSPSSSAGICEARGAPDRRRNDSSQSRQVVSRAPRDRIGERPLPAIYTRRRPAARRSWQALIAAPT